MNILELSEQEIVRRGSLDEMRKMGIDPYPAAEFKVTGYTDEIKENFKDDEPALTHNIFIFSPFIGIYYTIKRFQNQWLDVIDKNNSKIKFKIIETLNKSGISEYHLRKSLKNLNIENLDIDKLYTKRQLW